MSSHTVTHPTNRVCLRCGGSWLGRSPDPECSHVYEDEAREPTYVYRDMAAKHEMLWTAAGCLEWNGPAHIARHPTREGAIAAWQAEWRRRRETKRAEARAMITELRALLTERESELREHGLLEVYGEVCDDAERITAERPDDARECCALLVSILRAEASGSRCWERGGLPAEVVKVPPADELDPDEPIPYRLSTRLDMVRTEDGREIPVSGVTYTPITITTGTYVHPDAKPLTVAGFHETHADFAKAIADAIGEPAGTYRVLRTAEDVVKAGVAVADFDQALAEGDAVDTYAAWAPLPPPAPCACGCGSWQLTTVSASSWAGGGQRCSFKCTYCDAREVVST